MHAQADELEPIRYRPIGRADAARDVRADARFVDDGAAAHSLDHDDGD